MFLKIAFAKLVEMLLDKLLSTKNVSQHEKLVQEINELKTRIIELEQTEKKRKQRLFS